MTNTISIFFKINRGNKKGWFRFRMMCIKLLMEFISICSKVNLN